MVAGLFLEVVVEVIMMLQVAKNGLLWTQKTMDTYKLESIIQMARYLALTSMDYMGLIH
jgi:hypothetical protein